MEQRRKNQQVNKIHAINGKDAGADLVTDVKSDIYLVGLTDIIVFSVYCPDKTLSIGS